MQYPQSSIHYIVEDQRMVGKVHLARSEVHWVLLEIAILTEYRNVGIGTAVLRYLQEEAKQSNISIMLSVLNNSPVFRLYERNGFVVLSNDEMYTRMEWTSSG
ncbi:Mycothiol acetyltransferase [compost metagenome]